ncbi:hypothetical protein BT69DRAFT_1338440 [Atractiella rhizophila]|nr:hypothetical protein BT69DRAFT_1338440 [Atractiella rhizophila]
MTSFLDFDDEVYTDCSSQYSIDLTSTFDDDHSGDMSSPSIQFSFQDFSLESFALPRASIHTERSPARLGYHEDTYPSYALEEDHAAKSKGRLRHKFSSAFSKIFQKSNKLSPFRKQVPPEESHIVSTLPRRSISQPNLRLELSGHRQSQDVYSPTSTYCDDHTTQSSLVKSHKQKHLSSFSSTPDSKRSIPSSSSSRTQPSPLVSQPERSPSFACTPLNRKTYYNPLPVWRADPEWDPPYLTQEEEWQMATFCFPKKGTVPYNISW